MKEVMQAVVDYVEDHIEAPLSLEDCAKSVGYSKYHLHRLFVFYTGETLMRYVRKRKMQHASLRIRRGERIVDVALAMGYSSERAFSRAFHHVNQCAPSQCKKRSMLWLEPIVVQELRIMGGKRMEAYLSEIFYETILDLTVVSALQISMNPEEEVIAFLENWAKEHPGLKTDRRFGFDVPVSATQQDQGLRGYEFWISVTGEVEATNGVAIKTIPGNKYAVIRIMDPFADPFNRIGKGWGRIIEWVKENGYEDVSFMPGKYCLEEVKAVDDMMVMDIFVAIE